MIIALLFNLIITLLCCSIAFVNSEVVVVSKNTTGNLKYKDIGMILLHGANLTHKNYLDFAQIMANEANDWEVNLHIAIPDAPVAKLFADPLSVKYAVNKALTSLKRKMNVDPKKNIFISGHSMGGVFIKGLKDEYAGFIFYAANLDAHEVKDWTVPALQVVGERDGQMRMTKMASVYNDFKPLYAKGGQSFRTRFPISVLPVLTHSVYTDVERIQNLGVSPDLPPIDPKEEGYSAVAGVTLAFISAHSDTSNFTKDDSLKVLDALVNLTERYVGGYLKALSNSPTDLCIKGESLMAGNAFEGLKVNVIEYPKLLGFVISKPEYDAKKDELKMSSLLFQPNSFPKGRFDKKQGPEVLACKGETAESLAKKRNITLKVETRGDCQTFLAHILEYAEGLLTSEQLERYKESGRVLVAGPSSKKQTGSNWVTGKLEYKEPENGFISVSSPELNVPMDSFVYPGKHYCKVLHPASAVEYMIIDAFY